MHPQFRGGYNHQYEGQQGGYHPMGAPNPYPNPTAQQQRRHYIPSQGPSDVLHIHVTEITREALTEDMMYRVFGSLSIQPRRVNIAPGKKSDESNVTVQLASTAEAGRVMESLNRRKIFDYGYTMHMHYAQWPAAGGYTGSVLSQSDDVHTVPGAPTPQQYPPMQPQHYPPHPHAAAGMPYPGNYPVGAPQQPVVAHPGMLPPQGPGLMGYGGPAGHPGRGRGRGGHMHRGGFSPMGYQPHPQAYMDPMMGQAGGFAPMGQMGGVRNGRGRIAVSGRGQAPQVHPDSPTVFLSVTVVPEKEPLQGIFTLIEAFGAVSSIRRNRKKATILTVKMASIPDADNVVAHLRQIPFAGGTVSAKRFPTYAEWQPCDATGDPAAGETVQYDFTTARHRSPNQRCNCRPSHMLKLTGCGGFSEADIMSYFTGKSFFPDRISKEEDGAFTVHFTDADAAVQVLVACQNNVCGEENSSLQFLPAPPAEEEEGATATEGKEE